MNYLFENITVVPMDEACSVLENAFVMVRGEKIAYVGTERPADSVDCQVIDGKGKVMMPGLVNAHSHVPMTLLRAYADDYDLQTWLNDYIFPAEDKLDSRAVRAGTGIALAEAIASGTTSFSDMYYFCDDIIETTVEAGMKANISRGLTCFGGDFDFNTHQGCQELKNLEKQWQNYDNGRIIIEASVHAEYTSPPQLWKAVADFAHSRDMGIHVHLSETASEHQGCIGRWGKTPTQVLAENGVFDGRALAAHGVHLTEDDMDILKAHNVTVAHNPVSNGKLGSGVCPVPRLLEKGINVALGTDGVSSNNSHDMFEEMKTAVIIRRAVDMNSQALTTKQVLKMATVNGAAAQGRQNQCGRIAAGMDADLILLDFDDPRLAPCSNVLSGLVFSASGGQVCMNMVRGRILYENGQFNTLDIEKILHEVRSYAVPKIFG